ncbi:hypothetical protein MRX96_046565 [Rhipicephalus microplus]
MPVNQPVAQVLPAALGVNTGKRDTPTLLRAPGNSTVSSVVTVKATESSPAPKVGERKDSNEPPQEKSGVQAPTNVAAAPKRPHPLASNECAETTMPGTEEPPARTLQEEQPSIRPRPTFQPISAVAMSRQPGSQSIAQPEGTAGDGTV